MPFTGTDFGEGQKSKRAPQKTLTHRIPSKSLSPLLSFIHFLFMKEMKCKIFSYSHLI
jgi:hypothetical protein